MCNHMTATLSKETEIPKNDNSFKFWKWYYENEFKANEKKFNPNRDWLETLRICYLDQLKNCYNRNDKASDNPIIKDSIIGQKNQIKAMRMVLSMNGRIPYAYQFASKWITDHTIDNNGEKKLKNTVIGTSDEALYMCFKDCTLPLRKDLYDFCRAEIQILIEDFKSSNKVE